MFYNLVLIFVVLSIIPVSYDHCTHPMALNRINQTEVFVFSFINHPTASHIYIYIYLAILCGGPTPGLRSSGLNYQNAVKTCFTIYHSHRPFFSRIINFILILMSKVYFADYTFVLELQTFTCIFTLQYFCSSKGSGYFLHHSHQGNKYRQPGRLQRNPQFSYAI